MKWIYLCGVKGYTIFLKLISPFNLKASKWIKGRDNLGKQLSYVNSKEDWIWFHVASLGEFEQGKPVMEALISNYPEYSLLVTFFSPSGFEVRKDYSVAKKVMYLPLETQSNVELFLNAFKPKLVVFVKYDFWFEYMEQIVGRNIPLIFISSVFRKDQIFFKSFGGWFIKQLSKVDKFFVQDECSLEILRQHGLYQAQLSGDTRFDRVAESYKKNEEIPLIEKFTAGSKTLIFGSAWGKETEFAIKFIGIIPEGWKVLFAPHEINAIKIEDFRNSIEENSVLFSEANDCTSLNSRVMVLNTVGHLARSYKYVDVAVVGGGFTDGIHNILEPLAFGVPVAFGPIHNKFWEGKESIQNGVGFEINNEVDFLNFISKFVESRAYLKETSLKARMFIQNRTGATQVITKYVSKLLEK